jgi:hypothetical protein
MLELRSKETMNDNGKRCMTCVQLVDMIPIVAVNDRRDGGNSAILPRFTSASASSSRRGNTEKSTPGFIAKVVDVSVRLFNLGHAAAIKSACSWPKLAVWSCRWRKSGVDDIKSSDSSLTFRDWRLHFSKISA